MHDEPFLSKFPGRFITFHGLLWCYLFSVFDFLRNIFAVGLQVMIY